MYESLNRISYYYANNSTPKSRERMLDRHLRNNKNGDYYMSDMLNLERGTIPKNPRKFRHSFLFTEYVALYHKNSFQYLLRNAGEHIVMILINIKRKTFVGNSEITSSLALQSLVNGSFQLT